MSYAIQFITCCMASYALQHMVISTQTLADVTLIVTKIGVDRSIKYKKKLIFNLKTKNSMFFLSNH